MVRCGRMTRVHASESSASMLMMLLCASGLLCAMTLWLALRNDAHYDSGIIKGSLMCA